MRHPVALVATTLTASLLTACSPAKLLGAVQPAAPGGEVRDVAYARGPRHAMDIYLPAKSASGTAKRPPPVVVFFYGGGWRSGDRSQYRFAGRNLAACGALTFVPDYRVWPETGFPGFLEDAAKAVAKARDEAIRYGGDPSRLFLVGHSAGAYIAAMLALDPRWLAAEGIDSRLALAGTIGMAGPYDFLPLHDPVLAQIFAPVGPLTQPITFAANPHAPLLLMAGADDRTVDPGNSLRLAARVRDSGGDASTIVYSGIGHIGIMAAYAAPLHFLAPSLEDSCRFLGLTSRSLPASSRDGAVLQAADR
jgi:acetyl esterase/lipase